MHGSIFVHRAEHRGFDIKLLNCCNSNSSMKGKTGVDEKEKGPLALA